MQLKFASSLFCLFSVVTVLVSFFETEFVVVVVVTAASTVLQLAIDSAGEAVAIV